MGNPFNFSENISDYTVCFFLSGPSFIISATVKVTKYFIQQTCLIFLLKNDGKTFLEKFKKKD